jgi:hypothetical protein
MPSLFFVRSPELVKRPSVNYLPFLLGFPVGEAPSLWRVQVRISVLKMGIENKGSFVADGKWRCFKLN